MKPNFAAKQELFNIIENQMESDKPPEVNLTFNRLKKMGFSDNRAKELIGLCLTVEIFDALKNLKPFNEDRYNTNLRNLPKEPT